MGRFRKYHIKENIFWLISNCRSSSNQHWYIFVSLGILIVLSVQWCARQWPEMICHSLRSYHNISPPDPWKWSNGVGKKWNEHILICLLKQGLCTPPFRLTALHVYIPTSDERMLSMSSFTKPKSREVLILEPAWYRCYFWNFQTLNHEEYHWSIMHVQTCVFKLLLVLLKEVICWKSLLVVNNIPDGFCMYTVQ